MKAAGIMGICICRKTIVLAVCMLGELGEEHMLDDEPEFAGTTGGDTMEAVVMAKARI